MPIYPSSTPALQDAGAALAPNYGFNGMSYDPVMSNGTSPGVSGTLYLTKVYVPTATTISNVWMYLGTAGATLTSAQNYFVAYQANGNLIGQSADQSTAWTTTGAKSASIGSAVAVPAGFIWIGFVSNGTTPPAFQRNLGTAAFMNINGTQRFIAAGSGLTTTAPATLGTIVTSGTFSFWAAFN